MSRLELRGVTRRFGGVRALDGVDLDVADGELCVLLGPSGCGKSTLLRIVAGLERPTSGTISLDGTRVDDWEPKRRNVAMVFQNYALYPHRTVRGNLEFPLRMRNTTRDSRAGRVAAAARLLKIEHLLDRRPRELSGGQRQRVAIGRALVRDPSMFLLDEPLSNLDAQLRHEMRLEIVRLHRELKATMLYVTHDQVEAMTLGQRIVVLREGRVEQAGTPRQVYAEPATRFVAGFVGAVPMNFFEGEVSGGRFRAPGIDAPVDSGHEGPATLGVRPEHVVLGGDAGRARVEWVEDRGADRYAHLRGDGFALVARLEPGASADDASFGFRQIHLFADGRRILR